jgi:DNA-directed RNA polymerase subunit M/transcription elongation factor TFIIS
MDVIPNGRSCPKCGSGDYQFRSRKKIVEEEKSEAVETKYRCKACGHEWRERIEKKAG